MGFWTNVNVIRNLWGKKSTFGLSTEPFFDDCLKNGPVAILFKYPVEAYTYRDH